MDVDYLKTSDDNDFKKRQKQTNFVVDIGLIVNLFLAIIKTAAGIFGHSKALLSDGINSVSDVVYFVVVKALVKFSSKPADKEHPYGHHQFESIAAVIIGAFIIVTGVSIFWDSINTAFDILVKEQKEQKIEFFTLLVAILTIIIKIILMFNAKGIGRKTDNLAVLAIAKDHMNDIFASLGAAVGILLGLLGYRWVDPIAGALVAVIVVRTGIDILRESASELMDTLPDKKMDDKIREIISKIPEVKTVESVQIHKFGPYFIANITIGIDGNLKVAKGDEIADLIENLLSEKIEYMKKVYIHYHPAR